MKLKRQNKQIKIKEMRNKVGYFNEYKSTIHNKGKFLIWNDWK